MSTNGAVEREDEPQPEQPVSDGAPTVDMATLDDDPDDDDRDERAPGVPGSGRRPQRTRDYIKGLRGNVSALEAKLAERDRKDAETARELAELRGRLTAQAEAVRAQPSGDPVADEIKTIRAQQRTIMTALQGTQDPAQAEKLQDQWNELDEKKVELIAKRNAPQREERGDQEVEAKILESEFPDIYASRSRSLRAQSVMAELVERGAPVSIGTARKACQQVMRDLGLGPKPQPSASERARFAGTSGRPGTSGGSSQAFTPTKFQLSAARAWCNTDQRRDLEDGEKVLIWLREVGRKEGLVG